MEYNKREIVNRIRGLIKENKERYKIEKDDNIPRTQSALSEALGISEKSFRNYVPTVENLEKGHDIPLEYIIKLAEIFDCEVGYIIGEFPLKKRSSSDINALTGLSEAAIEKLERYLKAGFDFNSDIINDLINSNIPLLNKIAEYKYFTQDLRKFENNKHFRELINAYNKAEDEAFETLDIKLPEDDSVDIDLLYKIDHSIFVIFSKELKKAIVGEDFSNKDIKQLFNDTRYYIKATDEEKSEVMKYDISKLLNIFLDDY